MTQALALVGRLGLGGAGRRWVFLRPNSGCSANGTVDAARATCDGGCGRDIAHEPPLDSSKRACVPRGDRTQLANVLGIAVGTDIGGMIVTRMGDTIDAAHLRIQRQLLLMGGVIVLVVIVARCLPSKAKPFIIVSRDTDVEARPSV